jgi:hypothetical protein
MVSSNLVVTGLELMLIGNNIYMFADTGSSEQKQQYIEILKSTNFAFKIMPQLDFFLRFII